MKDRANLPYDQKVKGWNKSVSFLISKYAKKIEYLPAHERNEIFRQMLQASCDYWFGRNVYKLKKASYDYTHKKLDYEAVSTSPLPPRVFSRKRPTLN